MDDSASRTHPGSSSRGESQPKIGLHRRRLADVSDGRRVVVAHGPAGTGKTTFLRQHAAAWHGDTVWLECDGLDRSAPTLAARISRRLGGRDEHDLDRAVERLDHQLIVIDEIDRLPSSNSPRVLEAIVSRLPANCVLAFGTRSLDVLPSLERWRVGGELACVSGHDLRFRLWEVDRLFSEVYRLPLSVTEVHGVSSASGGWAAALHYFAVSLRQVPVADRTALISRIGRNNTQLRRYIRTQVLATLPATQRASLRRLAVFDRIDIPRAELLAPDAAHDLVSLVAVGVLDDSGIDGSFRMHSLLRAELLEELAAEQSPAHVHDLYLRAAQVLEQLGDDHEACLARARAGHHGAVAQPADAAALHAAATRSIHDGNTAAAREQLRAVVAMHAGDGGNQHAQRQLRALNEWLAPPPGEPTSWLAAIRATLEGRRVAWGGEHDRLVSGVRAFLHGDATSAATFLNDATDRPSPSYVTHIARLTMGCLALADGRTADAAGLGHHVWNHCRDDGPEVLALVSEALILAHSGSADDIITLTRLGASRDDPVVRAALLLIAAFARQVESSQRERYATEAALVAGAAGCTALERRATALRPIALAMAESAGSIVDARGGGDSRIAVNCIGRFEMMIDQSAADLTSLRPLHREVLAFLSSRPGVPVHREEIAEAIWPHREATSARRSLHTAVSAIRTWLESEGDRRGRHRVERNGDAYVLHIEPLDTDLGRLLHGIRNLRHADHDDDHRLDRLSTVVDHYCDEPYRTFGPSEWAVSIRRSTAAAMADLMIASAPDRKTDTEAWRALLARMEAVIEPTNRGDAGAIASLR